MTRNNASTPYINSMERRTFIKSATAMASIPALPTAAFGSEALSSALIARAEHMAGLWVHTSAQMMKNAFALDDHTANALFETLRDRNIVSAPNMHGVARAVLPCYENPVFAAKVNRLLAKTAPTSAPTAEASHHDLKRMATKLKNDLEQNLLIDEPEATSEDKK